MIFLILAATAIPIEWRQYPLIDLDVISTDVLQNLVGYIPIGLPLASNGLLRAVLAAALVSAGSEAIQMISLYRHASVVDVLANACGAAVGAVLADRFGFGLRRVVVNRWRCALAGVGALGLGMVVWTTYHVEVNRRGFSESGRLEAFWRVGEADGVVVHDASGQQLRGRFTREPTRTASPTGHGAVFDGANDYVAFGRSSALRLRGSMTVSAWINSSRFPWDDATIVSSYQDEGVVTGFQLDTTLDSGSRTVGFKIGDPCGRFVARYGATPLTLGTWYHVAGVFDAERQTLRVFLNGKADDGVLRGTIKRSQRAGSGPVYVGRRSDRSRYEFAGSIGDVRVYSHALTDAEILMDMRGERIEPSAGATMVHRASVDASLSVIEPGCPVSNREDARLPFTAALIGVLTAFACLGMSPSRGSQLGVALCFGMGLVMMAAVPALPWSNALVLPLTALVGWASIATSVHSG